jgi:hypothetical protein
MRRLLVQILTLVTLVVSLALRTLAAADEPAAKRPRAPADYQVLSSDRAGAYFVARPLKEKYDKLLSQLAGLRREISEARIKPDEARRQLDRLGSELEALRRQIDRAKLYIPGATVHKGSSSETIKITDQDLFLIDASNVEIRGWDRPEIRCTLEKTVLSEDGKGVRTAGPRATSSSASTRTPPASPNGRRPGIASCSRTISIASSLM